MLKLIRRLLTEPVYPYPNGCCSAPPAYLTLRELADLPPYHPACDSIDGCLKRR